jgi:tetratricopeptide (TPR) repeat protein
VVLLAIVAVTLSVVAGLVYAEQARRRAEQVAQVTRSILTGVDPAVARGRDSELLLMMLDQSKRVLEDPALDPRVELDLRETFALANSAVGRQVEAGVHARRADELIRRFEGDRSERRLAMLRVALLANRNAPAGDIEASWARNKAIDAEMGEIARANVAKDPQLPLKTEVEIIGSMNGLESERLSRVLEACRAEFGDASERTIRMMRSLARRRIDERNPEGPAMIEEARRLAIEAFGPDHPLVHSALSVEMMGVMVHQGPPEEAYRRMVAMAEERAPAAERVLGWRNQQLAYVYSNHGRALSVLGDHAEAINRLQRALDMELQARSDTSSLARLIRMNLIEAAIRGDRPEVALATEARVFELEPDGPAFPQKAYDDIIAVLKARGDDAWAERWTRARAKVHGDAADR